MLYFIFQGYTNEMSNTVWIMTIFVLFKHINWIELYMIQIKTKF